jgi:Cu(I)/Ag(I) efflux system membrane protein CusA/SilA
MRYGENALQVIKDVKRRLAEIRRSLPPGVELVTTYDRSGLIDDAVHTLERTLIEEMIVVSLVIFVCLLHVRSALIPALTLPIAVLSAFVPMFYQHLTANIMSLGGIAVAIGAMVDASIIMIENIHQRLADWQLSDRSEARSDVIVRAMQEVGPAVFFSLLVITVSFLPVFTLEGSEGRLFRPLAFTKTYAIGVSALLSITLTPALAVLFVRGRIRDDALHPIQRWLSAQYAHVVRFVVEQRWLVVSVAALVLLISAPLLTRLGSEFMPPLNEGVILYMPTAPPGMSENEASKVLQAIDREIKKVPEVLSAFGKIGRAETPTDPAPLGMVEVTVALRPRSQWRRGMSWDRLLDELNDKLHVPGMANVWWMPIQTRTEMLATGVRSPLGIEVFGDDLTSIEKAALAVERAVGRVPGTRSAFAERSTGGFYIDFDVDRERAARYGLTVHQINQTVAAAIGGANVSESIEGRQRYPINVRYAREFRDDPAWLGRTLIGVSGGGQIPISEVVSIHSALGPPMIRSEDGKLVGFVFVDTERPIADYVDDARAIVARDVRLPAGTRLSWVGQFKYFERAKARLTVIIPLTLAIVFLLLYLNTRSLVEAAIVMMAVPFSLVGAIWLLYFLDYHLSVAVWVGLIALAGLDAETGVVMLLYLTLAHRTWSREGRLRTEIDLREAIVAGAAKRLRPKLMTVATMIVGLAPILWSEGAGADVMRRIAAPMIGGLATSFVLELTVYPALFAIWKGRHLARSVAEPTSD